MIAYELVPLDDKISLGSTSGGAFYLLACDIINRGGVVFGAAFADDNTVVHKQASDIRELEALRGVKYVQSEVGDIYTEVAQHLIEGKEVLFVGTPCQVAGLKHYLEILGCDASHLLLVDLVCHCVPSPLVWHDFVRTNSLDKAAVFFRDKKTHSWADCAGTAEIGGREVKLDDYLRMFYSHEISRPSCYRCRFSNLNREGDITLGDAWRTDGSCASPTGVSLVLCNTQSGSTALQRIMSQCSLTQVNIDDYRQPQLHKPIRRPVGRAAFWRKYKRDGFSATAAWMQRPFSVYSMCKKTVAACKSVLAFLAGTKGV